MKKLISMLLCSLMFFAMVGCDGSATNKTTIDPKIEQEVKEIGKEVAKEDAKKEEAKKEDTKITYENFLNVKMGQSYDVVKEILGEGDEISSSEISGIKTTRYNWDGKGFYGIIITIQNGEVKEKSQIGLDDNYSNITMEQYNKIEKGITYEQLKAIAGEGQIVSETEIMNPKSITYVYNNENGSEANFTFSNDSMSMKSQRSLK